MCSKEKRIMEDQALSQFQVLGQSKKNLKTPLDMDFHFHAFFRTGLLRFQVTLVDVIAKIKVLESLMIKIINRNISGSSW